MTFEYLREYRTYFHISKNYKISESTAGIKWVEDTLIKHPDFALPGRKELLKSGVEAILIDATETKIERPKKNKNIFIQEKRRNIL
jgi:Helix-turn-helix of DDE superfamily endonuclease